MKTRFDLQYIRNNPAEFDNRMASRGVNPQSEIILGLDERRRGHLHASESARADAKRLQKDIGQQKKQGLDATDLINKAGRLNAGADQAAKMAAGAEDKLEGVLSHLPNLPAPDVPVGADETFNVELHSWGGPVTQSDGGEHDASEFNWGFEVAATLSGSRFSMLRGPIARLHRALGQFMLDQQGARGFEEVSPPLLVRRETMFGTGQLPKFEEDLFKVAGDTQADEFFLIPTAEVSLTNIVREQILQFEDLLPMRLVALTPCFRAEAGAAGRDTRGLIRQHQFEKVELVSITTPEKSANEHEYMARSAELILEKLELPYRRVLLCTGDMGFSAQKTYDLEVWMPGSGKYREISSVSNCGDFQARRMNTRVKRTTGNEFVHTLNGSGLAVGRTLAALVENNWIDEQTIAIPSALRTYLGGMEVWKSGF
jgi:seryl-tRNA synthetase